MGGGIFDFNGDDKLDFGEAMVAGGIIGAFADEMMRGTEKGERESKRSVWDDEDDDDDSEDDSDDEWLDDVADGGGWRGTLERNVDLSDAFEVMEAVRDPSLDWDDVEGLVQDALDAGANFDEDEIEEICGNIYDHDLKDRLRYGD